MFIMFHLISTPARLRLMSLFICLFSLPSLVLCGNEKEKNWVSSTRSMFLSGYTQVNYEYREGSDGFRIKRARLGLSGDVFRNIHYKLQVNVDKSPALLDGLIEVSFRPQLKLTLGQFKVPFSLENLTSSSALDTINRSQTVENLCPGRDIRASGRDIGITLNGQFSWINFSFGIFNGSGINSPDLNSHKDVAARLAFHPVGFLSVGLSRYDGRYSPSEEASAFERERTGIDIFYVQGAFTFKGEYIFGRDEHTKKSGWYIHGSYDLVSDRVQAILRYDSFNPGLNTRGDQMTVTTIGVNVFFTNKTKIQLKDEVHRKEAGKTSKDVFLAQLQVGF